MFLYGKKKWYLETWFIAIMIALWCFIIPGIIGIILLIMQIKENKKLAPKLIDPNVLDSSITDKQEKLNRLNEEIKNIEQNKKQLNKDIEQEKNQLCKDLEQQKNSLNNEIKSKNKELDNLISSFNSKQNELDAKLKDVQAKYDKLNSDVMELEETKSKLLKEIEDNELSFKKEQEQKEQYKKALEMISEDSIPIINSDGSIDINSDRTIYTNGEVLISEGGKTFHTYVGCYQNWPDEYKAGFKGWKKLNLEDAQQNGLRKCKYCKERDKKSISSYDDWGLYKEETPVKKFTVTLKGELITADDYNIGDEVYASYDAEKDKDTLEFSSTEEVNMPKSIKEFFDDELSNDYKMFIIDTNEDEFEDKIKIKIGVYKEYTIISE